MDFTNRICVQFILISPKILGIMLEVKSGFFFALVVMALRYFFLFVANLKSGHNEKLFRK